MVDINKIKEEIESCKNISSSDFRELRKKELEFFKKNHILSLHFLKNALLHEIEETYHNYSLTCFECENGTIRVPFQNQNSSTLLFYLSDLIAALEEVEKEEKT